MHRHGHCVYCGGLTTNALACRGHIDLLELDPAYNHELREATTHHWTPLLAKTRGKAA